MSRISRPLRQFVVRTADWHADNAALRAIREAVFIREQSVPLALEWDDFDALSRHVLAYAAGDAIGTGRLLPDGHIGRMAVLPDWRRKGVGAAILELLMDIARSLDMDRVRLNAQSQAVGFYARYGFVETGEEFLDAGIPHRPMMRNL